MILPTLERYQVGQRLETGALISGDHYSLTLNDERLKTNVVAPLSVVM
ncbi:hypothetical protein LVISKB_0036 [Levilactobacillus brevis KB290]|uniref:Uncharacterized protein n=1 Tax=Levilactobacillus brevis KB290 TaxID=1001583 RepID=M5AXB7_LEVBR|nr:hypothetical protein LVISKB_0036 [Levilactobacillus brevis KB290]